MNKLLVLGIMLLLSFAAEPAPAALSYDPANTFSGTAPAGSLTADFTDVAGGVQLVITSNLAAGENLDPTKALYFNFNPAKDSILQNLSFSLIANANFSQAATVATAPDGFKADGDGYYDINFTYTAATKAFITGESQTYFITDSKGAISAGDFVNYLSSTGGGNGTWISAIHVQNTPSGGSGSAWVGATTVSPAPLPAAAWLLGSGLAGMMVLRRKINA